MRTVVAIDGPAASGKSSTAKDVAAALGFNHVDSGSLYRAVTAARARAGGSVAQWTEAEVLAAAHRVTLHPGTGSLVPWVDGAAIDDELRSAVVTASVSRVAQMPRVREWVNARLREAAAFQNVVVDGRDMGTAVFPGANVKVYLVADAWERARRRVVQRDGGTPSDDAISEEMARLIERDARDAAQSAPAADAVVIDTSQVKQAEQVAQIVALARRALKMNRA